MWTSPDVREHVIEYTDFSISKFINSYKYTMKEDKVGSYDYVYAGEYDELVIPDVAINTLIDRLQELIHIAEQKTFSTDANYQSPNLSFVKYDNVTLYQFILFVNRIATNSNFNIDKLNIVYLLTSEQLNDILLDRNSTYPKTLKKINNSRDYDEIQTVLKTTKNNSVDEIEYWLNQKITNYNFADIKDNHIYTLLETEMGRSFIVKLITKLNKYRKRVEDNYV